MLTVDVLPAYNQRSTSLPGVHFTGLTSTLLPVFTRSGNRPLRQVKWLSSFTILFGLER
jgi:hypothetical protein